MNLAKINLQLIILAFHIFQAATFTTSSSSKTLVASNKSRHSLLVCFDNPGKYFHNIICSESGPLLGYSYCATYNENTKILSLVRRPYFQLSVYNITTTGYVQLPRNLSQLNDYMCGPLNRKGLVRSEWSLVWLWRSFHRCFIQLRRGWDTKSDIIDMFATFFILSYSKIMYQTTLLVIYCVTTNLRQHGG